MSDFFQKKKMVPCTCAARKNSIYSDTYKELYKNTKESTVDILILLEHKETPDRINTFKSLCSSYFKNQSYAVVPALGCTPEGFSSSDTIATYKKCKEAHIDSIIKKLQPKTILTTGRAIYTITESKELSPKHFYIPVNESIKSYHLDDCNIYSSEYNCNVFPIPPLYHWINEGTKDVYEYKFSMEQFKRAIKDSSAGKKRKPKLEFYLEKDPNKLLINFIDNKDLKLLSIDTESSSLNYFEGELYTIQFSPDPFTSYFCYWKDIDPELMIQLFDRKDIIFIMQNAGHDLKFLICNGIKNARCDFDTMLGAHMLNENSPNGLKPLTWIYTEYGGYDLEVKKYLDKYKIKDFTQIPENILLEYACYDSIITFILYEYFMKRFELEDSFLKENFFNYVMPAVKMIIEVEMTGVQVDMNYLYEYVGNLKKKAKEIEKEIYGIANRIFNLSSGKELTKVFRSLQNFTPLIDSKGKELLTKSKDLILDKEALERYADEKDISFAKKIIEYNHVSKEISGLGFASKKKEEKVKKKVLFKSEEIKEDEFNGKGFLPSIYKNRLHGGYKLHGTKPGRMAGGGGLDSTVNWQNQPTGKKFRMMFLPSSGFVFGRADYDAMEMCIISQLAGPGPLEDVILSGKDPHCYLAVNLAELQGIQTTYEEVFEKSKINIEKEFEDLRNNAKTFNFQLIYGATKYGLSNTFNITQDMAQEFLNVYAKTYPEVDAYIKEYRQHAQDFGWVRTLLGRKRRLPELTYVGKDSEYNKDSFFIFTNSMNAAINAPDQGTSGQTTVIAMTNIREEFKKRKMKSKVLINVHDEIVFELWVPEIIEAEEIIKEKMEQPYYKNRDGNKIRLTAELEIGEVWKYGKSKKYWNENLEEWKQCLENIERRNKNNLKIGN